MGGTNILTVLLTIFAGVSCNIIIESFTTIANSEFSNITSSLRTGARNQSIISVNLSLSYDVSRVVILYNMSVPKHKDDRDYSRVMIKRNADLCKLTGGNRGDSIAKILVDEVAKFADFEIQCPFPKGDKRISSFSIGNRHIPKFLVGIEVKFKLNFKLLGKIESLKKFVHLFSATIIGEIKGD